MKHGIFIEPIQSIPTFKKRFEIVERKGVGHPDTICDLVMDKISVELSKLYLKETGFVQHHNMDKAMLVAGQAVNRFGGGTVTKPMKMILGDRAVSETNHHKIPVDELSVEIAKDWFKKNLRFVKNEDVNFQVEIGTTSNELKGIFENRKSFASNDTSAVVGYAPFTKTESAVLETEQYINSKKFKEEFPESGEDVKVMGFRNEDNLDLTIAMAFVDRFVKSQDHYFKRKHEMLDAVNGHLRKNVPFNIHCAINCLDDKSKGDNGIYLTVLGTSADNADSGEVGRGNMPHRVISISRPAGAEAVAGKNPVSHIGKIYNTLSFKIANEIHEEVSGFEEVMVWMYNIIGLPVSEPKAVVVQPIAQNKQKINKQEMNQVNEIIEKNFDKINEFCMSLISEQGIVA